MNQFNAKKHGLIGGVSIKNLAGILIPVPPLDEQKRIVASSENLKYVGLGDIKKSGGKISYHRADNVKSTKNVLHKGNLLYGKLLPYLNKHGIADFDGIYSTDILVLDTNIFILQ